MNLSIQDYEELLNWGKVVTLNKRGMDLQDRLRKEYLKARKEPDICSDCQGKLIKHPLLFKDREVAIYQCLKCGFLGLGEFKNKKVPATYVDEPYFNKLSFKKRKSKEG